MACFPKRLDFCIARGSLRNWTMGAPCALLVGIGATLAPGGNDPMLLAGALLLLLDLPMA